MIDRHHLLECILWPNGDGTLRKIVNRAERLDVLGVYDDYKLTIPIDHSLHQTMHRQFEKGTEYERKQDGNNNPMYGRSGDKNPAWTNGIQGEYRIALRKFREGLISETELQPYRDAWKIEKNIRKRNKKSF